MTDPGPRTAPVPAILILATLAVVVVASFAVPAPAQVREPGEAGRISPELASRPDPLRAAAVEAEQARQVVRQALQHPGPDDARRVRRSLESLQEALAVTPWRGEAGDLIRQLGGGAEPDGTLKPGTGERILRGVEDLSEELRGLMVFQRRHPPSGAGSGARPDADEEAWRARLQRILEEEDLVSLDGEEDPLLERWLRQAFGWFQDKFGWILDLAGGGGGASALLQVLLAAGLLILAVFLGHLLLVRVRERRRLEATGPEEPAAVPLADTVDHGEEARRAAEVGDWDRALREGYLYLIRILEDAGLLTLGRSRTNGEVLEGVRSRAPGGAAAEPLRRANGIFDAVRYGGAPPGAEAWSRFQESVRRVEAGLRAGGEGP